MLNKFIFNKIYWNPNTNSNNEYEKGISQGMAFLTEKLIWTYQFGLDAKKLANPEIPDEEAELEAFKVLKDTLFNFQKRSKSSELFEQEETLKKYGGEYTNEQPKSTDN